MDRIALLIRLRPPFFLNFFNISGSLNSEPEDESDELAMFNTESLR